MFGSKERKQEKLRSGVSQQCVNLCLLYEGKQISQQQFQANLFSELSKLNDKQEARGLAQALIANVLPRANGISPIDVASGFVGLVGVATNKQDKYLLFSALYAIDGFDFDGLKKKLSAEGIQLNSKETLKDLIKQLLDTCVKRENGFTLPDISLWFDGIYGFGEEDFSSMLGDTINDIFDQFTS